MTETKPHVLTAPALDLPGIRHGFFSRTGGVSGGIYDSLNIGLGSGDARDAVAENRARAMAALGLPGDALSTLYQIHSAEAVTLSAPLGLSNLPKADGMACAVPGPVLGIATADCAPILFADADARIVGACHAGWKGALGGVIEATLRQMEALGAARPRIAAVLGPCIHQPSYEVGPEFEARFTAADPAYAAYFVASEKDGHRRFDLPGFVLDRLRAASVGTVGHVAADTYADPDRFFSYRRATHRGERGADGSIDYGRLLSAIALSD
jgi:YfiH family protein